MMLPCSRSISKPLRSKPSFTLASASAPTLLHLMGVPTVPNPDPVTDVDLARWQLDLIAAGCDCCDKLAAIRALRAGSKPPPSTCTAR